MTRLKPIGLTEADRQNPEESITPDRVKKLIDLYKKNHYQYPWTHEDKNERTFEYRKSLRPNTYQYRVEAIYRVRDPIDKSKEYYFYQKKGRILNQNDDTEYTNSLTEGFAVEPQSELRWDPKIKSKTPVKLRDNPVYFFKWDKKEVKKLLDNADPNEPCMNFYIGTAGRKGAGNSSATNVMAIKNKQDFLDGSFDDLVILNKSGMMMIDEPSLQLVEKAKKKIEEQAVSKVTEGFENK